MREVIGSLNWKKFADRIKTQLKENQLLTQAQRNTMQVNAIISLIKGNSLEEASALLKKTSQEPTFKSDAALQNTLRSIQVYLLVKDKKLEEALTLVKSSGSSNLQDTLLRAQLQLQLKR